MSFRSTKGIHCARKEKKNPKLFSKLLHNSILVSKQWIAFDGKNSSVEFSKLLRCNMSKLSKTKINMSGRISIVNFFPGDYDTTIKKLIELKMCTSSKNSVDSLKKKKVKAAVKILLTALLATFNSVVYIIHCQHALLQTPPLWAPRKHFRLQGTSMHPCTQHLWGAVYEAADKENSPNGMHRRSQVHRKTGSPLRVISPLFQCYVIQHLKTKAAQIYSQTHEISNTTPDTWDGIRRTN